jgi:hypothetical protein
MPLSNQFLSCIRKVSLAAPLALAALPLCAGPITQETLVAGCGNGPGTTASCVSATSDGNVHKYYQAFNNGFTLGLYVNGTAWTSGGQGGTFSLNAEVPIKVKIDGPDRDLVVKSAGLQKETLATSAGTVGSVLYGFSHFAVISRYPDGGDPLSFDFGETNPGTTTSWTLDDLLSHNFGVSMQLHSAISQGDLLGTMAFEETYSFFEADGVTPVNVLVSTTPEPGSLLLLLGAVPLGLFVARKRRASHQA